MPGLAEYLQGNGAYPQPLGGPAPLPDVRPREMRQPPLGQSNLVDRALSSFGQPSLDALRRGYAGEATPQEVARTFLETGPMGPFGAVRVPNPIRAYHGSPHDFDEFRTDKIGSGEGAQAYGHGLYFAQSEPVARYYRDALGRPVQQAPYRIGDNFALTRPTDPVGRRAYDMISGRDGDIEAAIEATSRGGFVPDRQAVLERLNHWRSQNFRAVPAGGRMYEVNLHARPEQFLDWDRPLAGQNEAARDAFEQTYRTVADRSGYQIPLQANEPLSEHYRSLANAASGHGRFITSALSPMGRGRAGLRSGMDEASTSLSEAGIPGIRYLDQGSRGAGQGTSNFVVFSPEIIEILRKYGIAGPMAAPATATGLSDYLQSPQN